MNDEVQRPTALGIAPGLDWAVAAIGPDGTLRVRETPTLAAGRGPKRQYDVGAMKALLASGPVGLAVVEAAVARPGEGGGPAFNAGYGSGVWVGLGIPYEVVTPQAWRKEVLQGTPRDRVAAIQFVQRRFPGVSLRATAGARTPHEGSAYACLAEFGRRLWVSMSR